MTCQVHLTIYIRGTVVEIPFDLDDATDFANAIFKYAPHAPHENAEGEVVFNWREGDLATIGRKLRYFADVRRQARQEGCRASDTTIAIRLAEVYLNQARKEVLMELDFGGAMWESTANIVSASDEERQQFSKLLDAALEEKD